MDDEDEESLEERQNNEVEALKSIFIEGFVDCRELDGVYRPPEIKLKLSPQQSMNVVQESYAKVTLYIKCAKDYPNSIPTIKIQEEKGLAKHLVSQLENELEKFASQLLGEVMMLEIAQYVMNYLHAHNKPAYGSCYEEMISNKQKQKNILEKENERLENERKRREEIKGEILSQEIKEVMNKICRGSNHLRNSPKNATQEIPEKSPIMGEISDKNDLKIPCDDEKGYCVDHQGSGIIKFNCIPEKTIRRSHCINHSENGEVSYVGIDLNTGEMVSITEIKIVINPNLKKLSPEDPDAREFMKQLSILQRELNSMSKINHVGLLKYIAMKFGLEKNYVLIQVLKEYPHGCCLSYYISKKIPVDMSMMQDIAQCLLAVLQYLHDNSIIHKDLNDEFMFMEKSGKLKLSDYTIHRKLIELISSYSKQIIVERYPLSLGRGGKKSDIYRLGLILLSLAQGNIISQMIPTLPSTLPPTFSNFLSKCLTRDENERFGAEQLLNHPFIKPKSSSYDEDEKQNIKEENEQSFNSIERPTIIPTIAHDITSHSRIREEFQILKWLGKGGYGDVLKVRNKLDGRCYALKRIMLNPSNRLLNKKITREVKLLSRLNHENVVRYYNSWIETSVEDTIDESNSTDTSMDTDSKSKAKSSSVSNFGFDECVENLAPKAVDLSLEWTMSSQHSQLPNSDPDSSSDEEDVFGISCLIGSESSGSIEFHHSHSQNERRELDGSSSSFLEDSHQKSIDTTTDSDKKQKIVQCMLIQMEFCENSTLRSVIDGGLCKEKDRMWRLFREIIEGLVHIHEQGMIHRDLKPVNIFLDSSDHIKIGDFGLATTDIRIKPNLVEGGPSINIPDSCEVSQSDQQITGDGSLTGRVGTALYVAPELSTTIAKPLYSQKVDIYSLGIIFFEMCYPSLSTGMERVKVLANVRTKEIKMPLDFEKHTSNREIPLIRWLLNHDQSLRPTSQELLSSELLPPAQIEETQLNDHFKKTISNPQSKAYKYLISNLFKQRTNMASDFTYDVDLMAKQSFSVKSALAFDFIKSTLTDIFQAHGAIHFNIPLLMPVTEECSMDEWNVNLMDHGGGIITLPRDLRVGFARAVGRRNISNIKRYVVDKVYREHKVFGGHPKELFECSFDIVTNSSASLLPDSEILVVLQEVITKIPQLKNRNYYLRLNHTNIFKAIHMYCGITEERLKDMYHILKEFKSKDAISELELRTRMANIYVSDHNIGLLASFINMEDSFSKVSNALKVVIKKGGPIGSLMKQGLHELECVINHAQHLGLELPILINPMMIYTINQFGGIYFQCFCKLQNKKRKVVVDVIAAGGCYDPLLHSFRTSAFCEAVSMNKENNQHGTGVSIAIDKIIHAITEDMMVENSLVDVLVCSVGYKPMIKEKCEMVKNMWNNQIKAMIQYDTSMDLDDVHEACKDLGISFLVILKESESNTVKIRILEKDRFSEKKVDCDFVSYFIIKSIKEKNNELGVGACGTVSLRFESKSINPSNTYLPTNNVKISFVISEKQKINQNIKKRYETQIMSSVSSLLQILSNKLMVDVLAIDSSYSEIKTIVSCLEVNGNQQEFNDSVTSVIEKHQRHRKYLTKVCDQIYELIFDRRSTVVVLYSVVDNKHKVII